MSKITPTGPGEYTMIDTNGIRWRCTQGGSVINEFEDNILAKMDADVLRAQEMARQQAGTEAYLKAILGTTGTFMYMDNNPVSVNHAGTVNHAGDNPADADEHPTPAPLIMGGQVRDAGSLRATAAVLVLLGGMALGAMAFVGGLVAFVRLWY